MAEWTALSRSVNSNRIYSSRYDANYLTPHYFVAIPPRISNIQFWECAIAQQAITETQRVLGKGAILSVCTSRAREDHALLLGFAKRKTISRWPLKVHLTLKKATCGSRFPIQSLHPVVLYHDFMCSSHVAWMYREHACNARKGLSRLICWNAQRRRIAQTLTM